MIAATSQLTKAGPQLTPGKESNVCNAAPSYPLVA